jgi:hypothetical protein
MLARLVPRRWGSIPIDLETSVQSTNVRELVGRIDGHSQSSPSFDLAAQSRLSKVEGCNLGILAQGEDERGDARTHRVSQFLSAERPSLDGVVQKAHCHELVIETGPMERLPDFDDMLEEVVSVGGLPL